MFERVGGLVERAARSEVKYWIAKAFSHETQVSVRRRSLAARHRRGRGSPRRAEIIEQILVKVNGEIFTKTELEQRQVAALRQQASSSIRRATRADAQLRKALDEITPELIVDAVDELLLVQRGKRARLHAGRRAVQEHPRQHQERKQDRDRGAVPGRAQAGRHDAGRPAAATSSSTMLVSARPAERGHRQDQRHRRRGARATTRRTRSEFTTPPTVTLREILDRRCRRATAASTSAGRRGARRQGRGDPQARAAAARASRSWPPSSPTRRRRPTAA